MTEKISQDSAPRIDSPDLTDQLKSISIGELGRYRERFKIYLSNGPKEGIFIDYLTAGHSPKRVHVSVDGDEEYWTDEQSSLMRAEPRNWK